MFFESEVDVLSNLFLELTNKGEFDEAERLCDELVKKYPEQVDGIMRLAALNEKRGKFTLASAYYGETAKFMISHPGFESGDVAEVLRCATRMERIAKIISDKGVN